MDFIERLQDYINSIGSLPVRCHLGYLKEGESLVIFPSPGSRVIREYMDGSKDASMNYTIAMKSKSQRNINEALWLVHNEIEMMTDIQSDDDSFHYNNLVVTSKPFISDADDQGWYTFMLDLQAHLTILKGVD